MIKYVLALSRRKWNPVRYILFERNPYTENDGSPVSVRKSDQRDVRLHSGSRRRKGIRHRKLREYYILYAQHFKLIQKKYEILPNGFETNPVLF